VPLSKIQSEILLLLAAHRDPESYVAGAVPLNRDGPRFSKDIDIFHDREERVAVAAAADASLLEKAGFAAPSTPARLRGACVPRLRAPKPSSVPCRPARKACCS
jgi:hypothetical protein